MIACRCNFIFAIVVFLSIISVPYLVKISDTKCVLVRMQYGKADLTVNKNCLSSSERRTKTLPKIQGVIMITPCKIPLS